MKRDEFTCCRCFSKDDQLHVHHKNYQRGKMPWDYPLNNFITLCHKCHDTVTQEIEFLREVMFHPIYYDAWWRLNSLWEDGLGNEISLVLMLLDKRPLEISRIIRDLSAKHTTGDQLEALQKRCDTVDELFASSKGLDA